MGVEAVIFDLDGTLVDTMPIHYEAYRRVFAEAGLVLTEEDFFSNIGGKASETIPKFLRGRPCAWSVEDIHRAKKDVVNEMLRHEPIPVLDTAHLLDVFRGRLPMALASSGSRPGIEIMLRCLGWEPYFEAVVTGEDAANGKPAPDLFLLAASRLDVDPAACVVFEDTDDGVSAARAAGMTPLDVRKMAAPRSLRP